MKNPMVKLPVTLFVITLVVALLLGVVNAVTKDKITENTLKKTAEAMEAVMPGAESYETLGYSGENGAAEVLAAISGGGRIGYVVKLTTPGSQGDIALIYAARDQQHNEAVVLKQELERRA